MRARADSDAGLLASAITLRWSRPDLTAALAEHVGETRAADDRMWLAAVGWLIHGRAAIGDGRECASDALAGISRRGTGLLDDPAADRLRIEIAALAAGQREPALARLLVRPVLAADRSADVRADAFGVLAWCVLEEQPAAIGNATRRADIAWAEVGGPGAEIATAALALLSAAGLRRSGHPDSAVDRAADGLARLDRVRAKQAGAPSRHLAAALAAEWITALIEAGRTEEAREGCALMAQQLLETGRPTRQIVLLRVALARALAADSASAGAFEALEQAAQDAADCDTPDLEGLCLSTLGTLREHAGRLDAALESMRRVVAAQRRDRARSERFRAALRAMSLPSPYAGGDAVGTPPERQQAVAPRERQRAASAVSSRRSPSSAIALDELVKPSYPPAGGAVADPWSTGRWMELQRELGGAGGRRHRMGPDNDSGEHRTAKRGSTEEVGEDAGGQAGLDAGLDAGRSRIAEAGATPTGVAEIDAARMAPTGVNGAVAGSTPAARDPGAPASADAATETIPVYLAEHGWHGPVDPIPSAAADPLFGPLGHIAQVDDLLDPDPATAGAATADGIAAHRSAAIGSVDSRVAVGADAVGCVVVIDAVRAEAPVTEGELLRKVGDRLTGRIPEGARLRCEPDESSLSVVLPGRERSAVTDWMHQTLPAVFADMDELGESQRWPTGTTLRAAVHDTDGPVGAQLMQRLDLVTPWPPTPRARHHAAPVAVVRWGVPIVPGSGGRRRRADDGSPTPGAHRDPDASDGRPDVAASRPTDGAASRPTNGAAPPQSEPQSDGAAPHPTNGAAPPQTDVAASSPTGGEAEFSVEGLGLADLLAGALAAYRRI